MKQWLYILALLFIIPQINTAQESRKIFLLCGDSQTLYDIPLGSACIEGTKDERNKIIKNQVQAITDFNNAFIAAKISSMYSCDNSNCNDPTTEDCFKSAEILRVKYSQRHVEADKYVVTYKGVIKISCSTCMVGPPGGCGASTPFKPVDLLVECGTNLSVSVGPATLYINGNAGQAANYSSNVAQAIKDYFINFPDDLPVNPKCYDIICEPGEVCIATKSFVSVTASPPVLVNNNPPCYKLDFYVTVNVSCSTCEKEEKEGELSMNNFSSNNILTNIYPNPARDFIMIDIQEMRIGTPQTLSRSNQNHHENIIIHLVDIQGKVLESIPLNSNERSIALSVNKYTDGIHFILIEHQGKIIERQKIVIQKE